MVNGSYLLKGPIWQWPTPVLMKSVYNEKPDLAEAAISISLNLSDRAGVFQLDFQIMLALTL